MHRKNSVLSLIDKIPPGFETRVQKEIKLLIFTELLEISYSQPGGTSYKDVLLAEIMEQPHIGPLFTGELAKIHSYSKNPGYRLTLEKNLVEYANSRTAAADLSGSIIALPAAVAAFGKMTPGSLAAGSTLAAAIAQETAVSKFVLGPTLGGFY